MVEGFLIVNGILMVVLVVMFYQRKSIDEFRMKQIQNEIKDLNEVTERRMLNVMENTSERLDYLTRHIREDFNQLSELTERRLLKMNESMNERYEKTNTTYEEVLLRMSRIDAAQKKLDALNHEVVSLQNILSDKKTRGIFGETQLNHILENIFGANQTIYHIQQSLPNHTICDVLLEAPEPLGKIVIDSKFPLENYRIMVDLEKEEAVRNNAYKAFRDDVKKHINDIAQKYIIPTYTANSAIMFIPAEAVFAYIQAYMPEIVDYSMQKKVWIVSPTTLMATLTTLQVIMQDEKRSRYASIIQEELQILATEFSRYESRWQKLVGHMEAMNKDVKDVSNTASKITKRFEKISEVDFNDEINKIS